MSTCKLMSIFSHYHTPEKPRGVWRVVVDNTMLPYVFEFWEGSSRETWYIAFFDTSRGYENIWERTYTAHEAYREAWNHISQYPMIYIMEAKL